MKHSYWQNGKQVHPPAEFVRYVPPEKQAEIYRMRTSAYAPLATFPAGPWTDLPFPVFEPDAPNVRWRGIPGWPVISASIWKHAPFERKLCIVVPRVPTDRDRRWNAFSASVPLATYDALPGLHLWRCQTCGLAVGDRDAAATHLLLGH